METPSTEELQRILARLDALEAENARLRAEIARKDQIIAGLQQRLFGSSSEKLDPAQLQLLFDELVLGKPAPPPEPGEDRPAREEDGKPKGKANRRTKAERFPQNLRILIDGVIEPDEVLANPDMWEKIGEEHHDELDVIKPEIFWRRTVRPKYRHKTRREQYVKNACPLKKKLTDRLPGHILPPDATPADDCSEVPGEGLLPLRFAGGEPGLCARGGRERAVHRIRKKCLSLKKEIDRPPAGPHSPPRCDARG